MIELEIDEMPAGKEIDDLIAERVMGWIRVWLRHDDGQTLGGHYPDIESCQRECPPNFDPLQYWIEPNGGIFGKHEYNWKPSASVADAWLVVEKLQLAVLPQWGEGFLVDTRTNSQLPFVECRCESAPLAICRTALKAIFASSPQFPSSS